jgi:hypothetical protein
VVPIALFRGFEHRLSPLHEKASATPELLHAAVLRVLQWVQGSIIGHVPSARRVGSTGTVAQGVGSRAGSRWSAGSVSGIGHGSVAPGVDSGRSCCSEEVR